MSTTTAKVQQIARSLDDKAYSEAFIEAEISTTIPFQIRSMRTQRKWTQAELAEKTEQNQKTISDFENPDIGPQTLTSLRKVAAAFDVGLIVRFAPFSEIVDWTSNLSKQNHFVPQRTKDARLIQQRTGKIRKIRSEDDSTLVAKEIPKGSTTPKPAADFGEWKREHAPKAWKDEARSGRDVQIARVG